MFISTLLIDTGSNPDRPRPGRLWLRNLYRVHQRLCMAFPSKERVRNDEHFLKPYNPTNFGEGQVHVKRGTENGFLFRIDPQPAGNVVILVLSAIEPDWDYAFHNAGFLLAAPYKVKKYTPSIENGQRFRFRLMANPTKKIDTISKQEKQSLTSEERTSKKGRHGKRVSVPNEELFEWLVHKGEKCGFTLGDDMIIQPGYVYMNKTNEAGKGQRLRSARYEGILEIINPNAFRETLVRGIGPGKAFGFGLLSIAPVQ
ncbi:MAG: type I-E CRISPR-associated protein Cas6/Cse3/CasE [Sedimentisphaerales bacterium]|nr:type I-E CRISPR-associated protein Cas6/Cse3/CasE [Sedimentisphaerales bacterium]